MHADITNLPVTVNTFDNAPVLGGAILAAVGCGLFPSTAAAIQAMVHVSKRVLPDSDRAEKYNKVYDAYRKINPSIREISHYVARGFVKETHRLHYRIPRGSVVLPVTKRRGIVVPSLLSADFGALSYEARACHICGAEWLHLVSSAVSTSRAYIS